MAKYRVTGIKGGGSSSLNTVVNALDWADAEREVADMGWEEIVIMQLNFDTPEQYGTPVFKEYQNND